MPQIESTQVVLVRGQTTKPYRAARNRRMVGAGGLPPFADHPPRATMGQIFDGGGGYLGNVGLRESQIMHCLAKSASVAILAAVSLLSVRANAAQLTGTVLQDGTAVADLDGKIIAGDAKSFDDLLQSAMATGRNVVGLRLNSPGGLVGEAAMIARSVSIKGIDVAVLPGRKCSSACFLIFAEGRQKYFSLSARIGVHGASIGGQETTGTEATTLTMARAISKLHVPPSVIAKMVTTPPTDMAWLTPDELISMGAVSDGPERNTPSATPRPPINNAISPAKYVLIFSNKNEIVLLDVNRIEETSAPMRRAWTTTFPAPSRRVAFKNAACMQMQADYDCSERRMRSLSLDLYGQDYSHLAGGASPGSWQAIIPESAGDAELRFVCSDAQMRAKTEISFGDAPFYTIAKAILTGPWPSQ